MDISIFHEPPEFLVAADDFLSAESFSCDVIAKVTRAMASSSATPSPRGTWALARDQSRVVGAAMLNLPWNLFVSAMSADAATAIADTLDHTLDRALDADSVPGVTGVSDAATAFADRWASLRGVTPRLVGERQVYVLDSLVRPKPVAGVPRRFRPDEVAIAAEWLGAFHDEAVPDDPAIDTLEVATARIAASETWAWTIDDRPCSLAACAVEPRGVARIGPVYTPPEHRGKGLAGGVVAAATQAALDDGATAVMLYADTANATSNALYQRLGFRPDHLATQIAFD